MSIDDELEQHVQEAAGRVVQLMTGDAGALLVRLARLEGMASRAKLSTGYEHPPDWRAAALFILGDDVQ